MDSPNLSQEVPAARCILGTEMESRWPMCQQDVSIRRYGIREDVSNRRVLKSPISKLRRLWRAVDFELTAIGKCERSALVLEVDD